MSVIEIDFQPKSRKVNTGASAHAARVFSADDGWPTTLRFSRHAGEHPCTVDYAAAIEGPGGSPNAVAVVISVVIAAVAGAIGLFLFNVR